MFSFDEIPIWMVRSLWSTVTKVLVLLQAGIIGHKYTFIACFLATGEFVTIHGLSNDLSIIALVDTTEIWLFWGILQPQDYNWPPTCIWPCTHFHNNYVPGPHYFSMHTNDLYVLIWRQSYFIVKHFTRYGNLKPPKLCAYCIPYTFRCWITMLTVYRDINPPAECLYNHGL